MIDDEDSDDDDDVKYRSEEVMRWRICQERRCLKDNTNEDLSSMMNLEAFSCEAEENDGDAFWKDSIRRVCGYEDLEECHVGSVVLGSFREGVDVYANRDFKRGEVVEVCAYVVSHKAKETKHVWIIKKDMYVLLLGFGSLYRRSDDREHINVCWSWKDRDDVLRDEGDESNSKQFVIIRAVRNIERGEMLILKK